MRKITLEEFKKLIFHGKWKHEQEIGDIDQIYRVDEDEDEIVNHWGYSSVTSTLDDIKIIYTEHFEYDECEEDTLEHGVQNEEDCWEVTGVVVLDEDGDVINAHHLADELYDDFTRVNYDVLEIEEITDFDYDEESKMETYILDISNAPNIKFSGELIAKVESSENPAHSDYSGKTACWDELKLYKTKAGNYVCHHESRTIWQGAHDKYYGKSCKKIAEVIEFFGHGWLAKDLYDDAKIENIVEID